MTRPDRRVTAGGGMATKRVPKHSPTLEPRHSGAVRPGVELLVREPPLIGRHPHCCLHSPSNDDLRAFRLACLQHLNETFALPGPPAAAEDGPLLFARPPARFASSPSLPTISRHRSPFTWHVQSLSHPLFLMPATEILPSTAIFFSQTVVPPFQL